jgi:hypothetical protein
LLQRYEVAQAVNQRYALSGTAKVHFTGASGRSFWQQTDYEFRRDGEKTDLHAKMWHRLTSADAATPAEDADNVCSIWSHETNMYVMQPFANSSVSRAFFQKIRMI